MSKLFRILRSSFGLYYFFWSLKLQAYICYQGYMITVAVQFWVGLFVTKIISEPFIGRVEVNLVLVPVTRAFPCPQLTSVVSIPNI